MDPSATVDDAPDIRRGGGGLAGIGAAIVGADPDQEMRCLVRQDVFEQCLIAVAPGVRSILTWHQWRAGIAIGE